MITPKVGQVWQDLDMRTIEFVNKHEGCLGGRRCPHIAPRRIHIIDISTSGWALVKNLRSPYRETSIRLSNLKPRGRTRGYKLVEELA